MMCDTDEPQFDPLLSDEPIDLNAVRADDALISALAHGDRDAARELVESDDELLALIAAWIADVRPVQDTVAETHLLPLGRSLVTGCCQRRLAELPKGDAVTDDPDDVTCSARSAT